MSGIWRASAVMAFAIALSGCFKSSAPLMTASDSVAPVPEGGYSFLDSDKKRKTAIVTHDGTATKFITIEDDGSASIETLLMRSVGQGYYLVTDSANDYGLIQIRDNEVIEYEHDMYCEDIVTIAQMAGSRPSDYGVASVSGSSSKTCTFTSMDNVVKAMQTLIERDAVNPFRTYTRQ